MATRTARMAMPIATIVMSNHMDPVSSKPSASFERA
jgi:hypothetical protein